MDNNINFEVTGTKILKQQKSWAKNITFKSAEDIKHSCNTSRKRKPSNDPSYAEGIVNLDLISIT